MEVIEVWKLDLPPSSSDSSRREEDSPWSLIVWSENKIELIFHSSSYLDSSLQWLSFAKSNHSRNSPHIGSFLSWRLLKTFSGMSLSKGSVLPCPTLTLSILDTFRQSAVEWISNVRLMLFHLSLVPYQCNFFNEGTMNHHKIKLILTNPIHKYYTIHIW